MIYSIIGGASVVPTTLGEVFVSGLRANTDEESVREIFKDMGLTTVKVCCEGKPDGQGPC